jgi:ATP-dependent DNA ligase
MRVPEVEVPDLWALDADNAEEVSRRHLECLGFPRRHRELGNFRHLLEALAGQVAAALNIDEAILDGEIIAADETGRPVFLDLLRGTRHPCYIAFDLLWLNGIDLRSLPLSERRLALQTVLPKASPVLSEALSVEGRSRELFNLMCTNDLEGVVAKRLADRYHPHARWLKIKNRDYSQKEGRADLLNGPRQRPWSREG